MKELLDKNYDPKSFEDKWYDFWEKQGYFHADVDKKQKPFSIVIPPPNITSQLHMGHGLNNTLQDILIRWKRMCGYNACWIPGTDHAGIATQNVIEKALAKENKTRFDLGREAFVTKAWEWREKYGGIILQQLRKMGCSCDWDRTRFTMDEGLSRAVRHIFVRLYNEGLIYKGERIINWCPRCTTALSDDEVDHKEPQTDPQLQKYAGSMYHIKYPIKDSSEFVHIATTRPETMLGDTGVAVNPEDKRYKHLIGKTVILPLVNRELPVVGDTYVDMEFGSGVVKVTPAHDSNDFEIGNRHKLSRVNVFNYKGEANDQVPEKYRGMDRFTLRKEVVKDLKQADLFIETEDHIHSVGCCYRCNTIIEPWLSAQWFVHMKPLAEPAIAVVKSGQVQLHPEHWKKTYFHWLENVQDWCISRQLWWGHRIPIWYCQSCGATLSSEEDIKTCTKCGSSELKQDEDVLDTWFSSWLWPVSTLGFPTESTDLDYFYPTDVLSTAPEIIFLWVARMIMSGLYLRNEIPFSHVYLHATVCDEKGVKQSKSLGNGQDPLDVIKEYGADALRFTVTSLAPLGGRLNLGWNSFNNGKRFANKLWNASRYILMNLEQQYIKPLNQSGMELASRWIMSRLSHVAGDVNRHLEQYRFNEAAMLLYHFIWGDFCDWFVEISKIRLYDGTPSQMEESTSVLIEVMDKMLRLLHPYMPFITEEIWQKLPHNDASIMVTSYPQMNEAWIDTQAEANMQQLMELITAIRNLRKTVNIPPDTQLAVRIRTNKESENMFEAGKEYIAKLAKMEQVQVGTMLEKPEKSGIILGTTYEAYVQLEGHIDFDVERARLEKELMKVEADFKRLQGKLSNENFVTNAPENIVQGEREKFAQIEVLRETLIKNIEALKSN